MRERLAALCPFLTGGQLGQFETYYAMLVEWNTRMNLTALTEPAEVAEKHFADSLLPMALVPEGARCIDVGTGAGFPGVPILIARPDLRCVMRVRRMAGAWMRCAAGSMPPSRARWRPRPWRWNGRSHV